MELILLMLGLGFVVSLSSGMLGIGGGILMAPALLYLPPLLGHPAIPMHIIGGLTISQSLAAAAAGAVQHRKRGYVDMRLVLWMAIPLAAASLAGSLASPWASPTLLKLLFSAMAFTGAALMCLSVSDEEPENPPLRRSRTIVIAVVVGLLGGAVGQGGSFLLIPLMIHLLGVPTRIAIGSNLGIVLLGSATAFLGKLSVGQVHWQLALSLVVGAIVGALLGSRLGHSLSSARLRHLLAALITIAAMGIAADALLR